MDREHRATRYTEELVGVLGYPVAENPTGVMQNAAFEALGLPWRYLTIEVRPAGLPAAISGLRALGFRGINLTIPHKVAALALLDEVSPVAALIGAVNTVRRVGDRLIGENTDGKGFLRGVREGAGLDPRGKSIVVLGAGGAARAITVELALAGAARLIVVNRTVARGQALVDHLKARTPTAAQFVAWAKPYRVDPTIEIVVNATSIGLSPEVDSTPDLDLTAARPDLLVCDVIPNPPDTRLIQAARARGFKTLNGLSMLVYQGTLGFEMWTGQPAPEAVMLAALAQALVE